jgi:hypothetical protein
MYSRVVLEYEECSQAIHVNVSWQTELSLKLQFVFSLSFARLCTESVIVAGYVKFTTVSDFRGRP